jgi:hypothetical protein
LAPSRPDRVLALPVKVRRRILRRRLVVACRLAEAGRLVPGPGTPGGSFLTDVG